MSTRDEHPPVSARPEPDRDSAIDRREALRRVSAILGGVALVGGNALWAACRGGRGTPEPGATIGTFTPADVAFLDEVADTMLPETATPGAKAAHVGAFMALMVTDCYEPRDQDVFRAGMRRLDDASRSAHGVPFMAAPAPARLALLESIDREQKAYMDAKPTSAPSHYFRMMKELAFLGYFTSEIGCTRAQRYVESPGRYDPCVPYVAGTPAWARHG